ncbi:hypothetical protein JoomaDRAFT_2648 [Galbibacter orientalis DSM 19592]|uniref:Coenzyme Q-binding protein COQ10 START domain-containing protein n=1 Tax=Galbibacter orientalis DSM 19592 TaxID=926559 RepID=I3C7M7_9FLAO|nr:SRPBCC family protein [Galbibacter orientalis]EIJ39620.1 hypothetical protein JoomaDRAFT_2648 [Galbibacter orientalis DSM 19592]
MSIKITSHSGIYQLRVSQEVNASIKDVWEFFINPQNLNSLTPKDLDFKITSPKSNQTYKGQIITYSIKVLPLYRTNWVTEITQFENQSLFVDEQRLGPYKMLHHEHHFKKIDANKTLVEDIVTYKLPFGLLGRFIGGKIIRKRFVEIFTFRKEVIFNFF